MQILRTVLWIAGTAVLVAFIAMNWVSAPINLWPLEGDNYIHFQWPVGFIALIFFALGFGPMWFINRTNLWRLNRRIASLENSLRITANAEPPAGEEKPETKDQASTEGPNEP